jgi:archaellum component FlaG (FlaF/FlaG flagellin family)
MVTRVRKRSAFLIFLFIFAIFASSVSVGSSVNPPKVFVVPLRSDANVGGSFAVDVNIVGAVDVRTFEFKLGWDKSVLNATVWDEGDFLSQGGARTTFVTFKAYNDRGYIYVVNTIQAGTTLGVSGSGTLSNMTFVVKNTGATGLYLYDVSLADSFNNPVPNVLVEDAYVNVTPPMFHVDPSSTIDPALVKGDTYAVNVTLTDAAEVRGFQFKMHYNSTLLNVTGVTAVPFLNEPVVSSVGFNNTLGLVWVNINSTAADAVTKDGAVATVTFYVNATGETSLDISDTLLDDGLSRVSTPAFVHRPPADDGYFSNIPAGHDIQVVRVTVSPTKLSPGEIVHINATIRNLGAFNETFDITVSYGQNVQIAKKTGAFLGVGEKDAFEFSWDTSGLPAGPYTVKVQVTVAEDSKPSNNVASAAPITLESGSGLNWMMIGAVAAGVVVVAAVALYFLKFRKPKTKATEA